MYFEKVGKTREQWGKLILYSAIAVGAGVLGSRYPVLGQYTGILVGSAFVAPLSIYAGRVSRYFQNVRFEIPKYIITGDGGDNYFSVITKKYWNPFWVAPIDHIKLPIMAQETIIPVGGVHNGGVCSGQRPLSAISTMEKHCFPLPHNATVGPDVGHRYIELLEKKNITGNLTEDEYYELKALTLFSSAGIEFL